MTIILSALSIVVLAHVSTAHAADWAEFRGPTGQGHAAVALPTKWSAEQYTWRRELPGHGWSSPTLYRDVIYLTAAVPFSSGKKADQDLRVFALNAKTGKPIFETAVFRQDGARAPNVHSKNSHASPTLLAHGDKLYAHFGHQGVACLNLEGDVLWTRRDYAYTPVHGAGGSPVIVGDALIFTCDANKNPFVLALNKDTGQTLWRVTRDTAGKRPFSFCTPLAIEVNGQKQLITPGSDAVFAYDPANGRTLWRVNYKDGYSVVPRPVYAHGLVYVCTGFNQPSLFAIRPTGRGDVTQTHVVWSTNSGVPKTPSVLVVGDELYMVADNGVASCVDAKSGKLHWKERIGGAHSASPTHANGLIYFQTEEGETIIVKAGKTFREVGHNRLNERTFASFAADEDTGALFIRSEKALYRID
jgi:outer membrane protein assembly factor BamB